MLCLQSTGAGLHVASLSWGMLSLHVSELVYSLGLAHSPCCDLSASHIFMPDDVLTPLGMSPPRMDGQQCTEQQRCTSCSRRA
jgi:hypothetical protein